MNPPQVVSTGFCIGGEQPDPPLHDFPLLAWAPNHAKHGANVFTEDGHATVADIAAALPETMNFAVLAKRFNTTEAHIGQAVAYAVNAGIIKGG